jgi:hypothetical protein
MNTKETIRYFKECQARQVLEFIAKRPKETRRFWWENEYRPLLEENWGKEWVDELREIMRELTGQANNS